MPGPVLIKRNIDDVLDAIARAAAETRGLTLDQIDHRGDAQAAWARKLISITLEDYWGDLPHEVPAAPLRAMALPHPRNALYYPGFATTHPLKRKA